MAFAVTTAKSEITPTLASNPYLGGYGTADGGRTAETDEPYEPLYCRAVILWDDGSPNLVMSVDVLALPRSMHQSIRAHVVALSTWATSDILFQATHTHNGPALVDTLDPYLAYGLTDTGQLASYSDWLADTMVQTAQEALAGARTPVTLDYNVAAQSFAVNRAGLPYAETDVPILVARTPDGTPAAILFGYGCHPVAAGGQLQYDGDYPARACAYIEENTGAFALFLQGPAGDQNPADTGSWALRDQFGDELGETVADASGDAGRDLTGPILTQYREVPLPFDVDLSPENLAAVRADYASRVPNPSGQPDWYQRHAALMLERIDNDDIDTALPTPFQVWSIGGEMPLQLAFVGGELVSGYGEYFRARYGGSECLWIGG